MHLIDRDGSEFFQILQSGDNEGEKLAENGIDSKSLDNSD